MDLPTKLMAQQPKISGVFLGGAKRSKRKHDTEIEALKFQVPRCEIPKFQNPAWQLGSSDHL